MKFIAVLLLIFNTNTAFSESSNCDSEALEHMNLVNDSLDEKYALLGSFQDDLTFFVFFGDTYNESLVYEVEIQADEFCRVTGFYEHSFYTDEFEVDKVKEYSIFNN